MTLQNNISPLIKTFCEQILKALPKITTGIVIFIIVWLVALLAQFLIVRFGNSSKNRKYLFYLLGSTAKIFILIAGAISALGTMGINISALVASLGLVGFALGFALKDALSNLLAGFLILFYKPFAIGDQIEVMKLEGEVITINLRYTIIQTDSQRTLIPNSSLLSNPVIVKENQTRA